MQNMSRCSKIDLTGDNRIICPACGRRSSVYLVNTSKLIDFPFYCKLCHKRVLISCDMSQSH